MLMKSLCNTEVVDVIGVGIGPSNLSLAALLSPIKNISSCFYDRNDSFSWHPGMLLPNSEIQVNYLNDLVTLVDPTNPFSFIAYLAKHKRLYRFINAQFKYVLRSEFSQYLNWVSRSISNLFFNEEVIDVYFDRSHFSMQTSKRIIKGKHLVLGNGLTARIPSCAHPYLGKTVFHNSEYLYKSHNWYGKSIAVIGGGQSGAEIVHSILSCTDGLPEKLIWISRRNQLLPMDTSPFVNEFFTPNYANHFYQFSSEIKSCLLQEQLLASDGISEDLLRTIYQQLYRIEFLENKGQFFQFLSKSQIINIESALGTHQYLLLVENLDSENKQIIPADIIILCTGYEWTFPPYLSPLSDQIPLYNNKFYINHDFSVSWNGPNQNRIYVQNGARHSHGIADPNLNIMAWRSATIINSIIQKPIYDLNSESSTLNWEPEITSQNQECQYASIA
ncbi:TPA: SidA/IucD/PvdA family monooxygenase [Legionella pneumophila]|nr:SidA/IucD/PvdA family monooxygenase [Legionella pneumophila]HDV5806772.1 SidA/IucD/PvdA family monooxygenase [Legionella pneumophila]